VAGETSFSIFLSVLGLGVAEVGAIAAGIEIIIGVLKMRAPGMTLSRMPLRGRCW